MYGIDGWSRHTIRDSTLGRPTLGLGNTPTTSDLSSNRSLLLAWIAFKMTSDTGDPAERQALLEYPLIPR